MDPRLAGFTQRLQSIPGAPVSAEEIAQRVQYVYDRLKGRIPAPFPQSGGGTSSLPRDMAEQATSLFSQAGGAGLLEGMAEKAQGFAQSKTGQGLLGKAEGLLEKAKSPDPLAGLIPTGAVDMFGKAKSLASGNIPRAKGPTLESFLESQGVPQIPVTAKKVPGDFLGNGARWWVKVAASPYLGTLVKLTFFFMFFLSFLESTPLIGSALSVAMDATLAGGRVLVKVLQKGVPAVIGLIPLPYTQLVGVILVSVVGMFVWTILAIISFQRQDFTSAIDSMLRILPPPLGDSLGDAFLELNRTADQFNDKRIKLTEDIWNGLLVVQEMIATASKSVGTTATGLLGRVQAGSETLLDAVRGIRGPKTPTATPVPAPPVPEPVPPAAPVPAPPVPEPVPAAAAPAAPAAPAFEMGPQPGQSALDRLRSQKTSFAAPKQLQGGKRLSTKTRRDSKWKTHPLYERFSGLGLR